MPSVKKIILYSTIFLQLKQTFGNLFYTTILMMKIGVWLGFIELFSKNLGLKAEKLHTELNQF